MNDFIRKYITSIEISAVTVRIISFTLVSWLGPKSPFLLVWILNTADAIVLTYCANLKKDFAYILLNAFWIIVGIIGIVRASGYL